MQNKFKELFVELRAFDCDLGWHNRLVAQYPHVGSEGVWMVEKAALDTNYEEVVDNLSEEIAALKTSRDAYAEAMGIAMSDGIFPHKNITKAKIEAVLSRHDKKESK
jgi:phytoene dehydrogenase-like protein